MYLDEQDYKYIEWANTLKFLPNKELRKEIEIYQNTKDEKALEKIYFSCQKKICNFSQQLAQNNRNVFFMDLVQEANRNLIGAVNEFDLKYTNLKGQQSNFYTYFHTYAKYKLLEYIAENKYGFKLYYSTLSDSKKSFSEFSFNEPVNNQNNQDYDTLTYEEVIGEDDTLVIDKEYKQIINSFLIEAKEYLNENQWKCLYENKFKGISLKDIDKNIFPFDMDKAKRKNSVNRYLGQALNKIREKIGVETIDGMIGYCQTYKYIKKYIEKDRSKYKNLKRMTKEEEKEYRKKYRQEHKIKILNSQREYKYKDYQKEYRYKKKLEKIQEELENE